MTRYSIGNYSQISTIQYRLERWDHGRVYVFDNRETEQTIYIDNSRFDDFKKWWTLTEEEWPDEQYNTVLNILWWMYDDLAEPFVPMGIIAERIYGVVA